MAVQRTFVCLAAMAVFIELAMAANYTVGGTNGGWDTSTDLQSWVSSQTFAVGDNLIGELSKLNFKIYPLTSRQKSCAFGILTYRLPAIFRYTPNHDVLEVTKADHDSCQTSSPLQTYNGGNTVVPLTSPGKRYFIYGTLGHYSQGMQIEIDTLATSTPPPAASPSSSPALGTFPSPIAATPESAPGSPLSPDVPSAESPGGVAPSPPAPSSAIKNSFGTCFRFGFGLVLMVLLAF